MVRSVEEVEFKEFVLVGFSMGGYVAQEFALKHPKRIQKLILIGSSSEGYPPKEKEIIVRALPQIEKGLFRGLTEKRLKEFLHPRSYEDKSIRDLIHSMAGVDAGEVYLRQLKATLDRRNLSAEIRKIQCPISLIAGKDDQIIPVDSILRMERYAPDAEINVVPDCGHFVPLEKPERVNEIIYEFASR
jgi:pimeloyl-ACP methyl ester carboxylesterase